MSKLSKSKTLTLVVVFLSVIQLMFKLPFLTRDVGFVVGNLTIDDTYYYLETAWNTKVLGFPTFDRVHSTSGVQLLWYLILVLASYLTPSKIALLYTALFLCFVFNTLCYLAIFKIGEMLDRPILTITIAVTWFFVSANKWYHTAMENSLHALVFWLLLWQIVALVRNSENSTGKGNHSRFLATTVLLVLNVWTRVDAAVYSAMLYVFVLLTLYRSGQLTFRNRRDLRLVLGTAGIAVSGALIMGGVFWIMDRSVLPVSGRIKMLDFDWQLDTLRVVASRGFELVTPFPKFVTLVMPQMGSIQWQVDQNALGGWLGLLAVVTVVALFHSQYSLDSRLVRYRTLWKVLLATNLVYLFFLGGLIDHALYGVWYLSPYLIFATWTVAIAVDGIYHLIRRETGQRTYAMVLHASLTVVVLVASALSYVSKFSSTEYLDESLDYTRVRVSSWISENLDSTDVCSAYHAGELGFFTKQSVINLDGLINDKSYYEDVIVGDLSLVDYLHMNGVSCFIQNYSNPQELKYEELRPHLELIKAFEFRGGSLAVRVFKIRY